MFGPNIRFPSNTRLELHGTPVWIPIVLLAIIAFSLGLAWVFLQEEELWSETAMGRMLHLPSSAGHYVASWPVALMTLALGLPWALALTQVRLRSVILDATQGTVLVRPLGALSGSGHEIPFGEITGLEIARVRAPLLQRLTGRSGVGTRPVLHLTSGKPIPLVSQPIPRKQSEKIVHMAKKVLPSGSSESL